MKPPINEFWGKLTRDENGVLMAWHPLLHHCADVAATLEALLRVHVIQQRLACLAGRALTVVDVARLGFLAALHDMGKVNHGFQAKSDPLAKSRWAGHVSEMLWVLFAQTSPEILHGRMVNSLALEEWIAWFDDQDLCTAYLAASIAHHGKPANLSKLPGAGGGVHWEARPACDPAAGIARLVTEARGWFPLAFDGGGATLPSAQPFVHVFSGLVMLADWIASDSREGFFPYSETPDVRERMQFARASAADVLMKLGLDTALARAQLGSEAPNFDTIRASPEHTIRPAQQAVGDLSVPDDGGIVVLEAETGSGKTEAALLYFVKLFHAGVVDGLYFALPTRTAATQIHQRVSEAVARVFPQPRSRPAVVLAVPGYLQVDDLYGARGENFNVTWQQGKTPLLSSATTLWPDDERFRFRGWTAEHPKRYLAGTVVVGTIDQVLLSALKVGHAHMRTSALLRHLLVVDEVHASDAYMTTILAEVLHRFEAAGGHAFLMSATLGAQARTRLLQPRRPDVTVPGLDESIRTPYPLLSHRNFTDSAPVHRRGVAHQDIPRRIRVLLLPYMEDVRTVAQRALVAARLGARVLLLRNTVGSCVATQQVLEELTSAPGDKKLLFGVGGVPAPHHSRFARVDRMALDAAVEERFGKQRRGSHGAVAVVTQTVQQSLDLDADLMITDLCPMDVLLQRIGRLHRHQRDNRPKGFEQPLVEVLVPGEKNLTSYLKGNQIHGPQGSGIGTVYDDLRILQATWNTLIKFPILEIPTTARELVEQTLHPEALDALVSSLGGSWAKHAQTVIGTTSTEKTVANLNVFRLDEEYEELGFSRQDDGKIQTRLGEEDRLVTFPSSLTGPFGYRFQHLTIPHWLAQGIGEVEMQAPKVAHGQVCFALETKAFVYDRLGLRENKQGDTNMNGEVDD